MHIGQKVECIAKGDWAYIKYHPSNEGVVFPEKGKIYTVRGLVDACNGQALLLREIVTPPPRDYLEGLLETCWPSYEFRPITETKASIEVFEKLLNPKNHRILEDT